MTKNFISLMDEVDKEAQRRLDSMTPEEKAKRLKILKMGQNADWSREAEVLKVLQSFDHPVGTNTISALTGVPNNRLLATIHILEKNGVVKKATAQKVSYWEII